jgi:hypothetical protein
MKRAFLCGINYTGTSDALNGCINDVANINKFLVEKSGYDPKSIMIITDDPKSSQQPTKKNMELAFNWLIKDCKAGDTLLFHYSGHGATVKDTNGDETDKLDSVLVPVDYLKSGVITDDWLYSNVVSKLPSGVTLWGFTDCCHSGTMLDLTFNLQSNASYKNGSLKNNIRYNDADWSSRFVLTNERTKECAANVYLFSGCLDAQTAADATIRNQAQGAFSSCLLECLNSNLIKTSDGKTTINKNICDILKEIDCRLIIGGFSQRSQLSMGKMKDFDKKFLL